MHLQTGHIICDLPPSGTKTLVRVLDVGITLAHCENNVTLMREFQGEFIPSVGMRDHYFRIATPQDLEDVQRDIEVVRLRQFFLELAHHEDQMRLLKAYERLQDF